MKIIKIIGGSKPPAPASHGPVATLVLRNGCDGHVSPLRGIVLLVL